jgi:hypothetical protein
MHTAFPVAIGVLAATIVGTVLASGCSDLSNGGLPPTPSASAFAVAAPPRPGVEITSPPRASFQAVGPITVEGTVSRARNNGPDVRRLELNGRPVTFTADGRFRTTLNLTPGMNVIQGVATDLSGQTGSGSIGVLAGTWKPMSTVVDQALGIRINDSGCGGLEKLCENAIQNLDLNALTQGPVYRLGWPAVALEAYVRQIRWGLVSVSLDPQADGLHLVASLQAPEVDFDLGVSVNGQLLQPEPVGAAADWIIVRGRVLPTIGPDGKLDIAVAGSSAELPGLRLTLRSPILQTVETYIRILTQVIVEDQIRRAIDQLTAPLDPIPIDSLGRKMLVDVRGNSVRFDNSGFEVVVKASCEPQTYTARGLAAPGYYSTPGTIPPLLTSYGLHIAIDDDALNHAAHAVWATGFLKFDSGSVSLPGGITGPPPPGGAAQPILARDILQFLPELYGRIDPNAPVEISAEAMLPPVFRVGAPPDVLVLDVAELLIDLRVDNGKGFETVLKIAAHISVALNCGLDTTGLWMSTATTPHVTFDVIEEPIIDIDDRRIEVALGTVLTPAIPYFVNKANLLVPIPYVGTLSFFNLTVEADGADREHLTILSNLGR